MITISLILIIWGAFATHRINKLCKKKNVEFNPFEGNLIEFMGVYIGCIALVMAVIYVCKNFLY